MKKPPAGDPDRGRELQEALRQGYVTVRPWRSRFRIQHIPSSRADWKPPVRPYQPFTRDTPWSGHPFLDWVLRLRRERNWSLHRLSAVVGCKCKTIQSMVKGQSRVNLNMLWGLLEVLTAEEAAELFTVLFHSARGGHGSRASGKMPKRPAL